MTKIMDSVGTGASIGPMNRRPIFDCGSMYVWGKGNWSPANGKYARCFEEASNNQRTALSGHRSAMIGQASPWLDSQH